MFYNNFQPNEDRRAFLTYFETDLTMWPLEPMESKKCQQFHNFLHLGWDAEDWYEEFENLALEVLTSWESLCKHFCVKWLGANLKILLEILEIHAPTTCTAMMMPIAIGYEDTPQHFLSPTTSSQPSNDAPTIPKLNPILPKPTTAPLANKMMPKATK